MKNPTKELNHQFLAHSEKFPGIVKFDERASEALDFFDSDLHDRDVTTMAKVYGGDFRKVWEKTHKKWWV